MLSKNSLIFDNFVLLSLFCLLDLYLNVSFPLSVVNFGSCEHLHGKLESKNFFSMSRLSRS